MKKSLSSTRNMYQVVINIIVFFTTVWSGFAAFATGVTNFKNKVQEIDETAEEQGASLKSYTANKKSKKRDMANKALITCGKIRAFAFATGDIILLGKLKIPFYKLYYEKDTTAKDNAELIYSSAQAMTPAERAAYGITDPELVAFRASIDTFENLPSPQQVRAIKKQLTAFLTQLFQEGNLMLKDTLDGMMHEFKESNPDFYQQYINARRTYENHRHTTVEGAATDETTGADLPNVQVLITSSTDSFEEMTDVQGNYKQQISPEIDYKVKFTIPGYESQEFENVNLNRGEHERLNVKLKKLPNP